MKKLLCRFPFDTTDNFTLKMPEGAEILSVQTQDEQPCLWALVDPNAKKENRMFCVYGVGREVNMDDTLEFIGTYQLQGISGTLVFHIFEVE